MSLLSKVKSWKSKIKKHELKIQELNKLIENTGYDEPVECLGCGWKGVDSEIIFEGFYSSDAGWTSEDEPCCPKCRSTSYEYSDK